MALGSLYDPQQIFYCYRVLIMGYHPRLYVYVGIAVLGPSLGSPMSFFLLPL